MLLKRDVKFELDESSDDFDSSARLEYSGLKKR